MTNKATLQEILNTTEFPIETVYQDTAIKIEEVSIPEFTRQFKVTNIDGPAKRTILMGDDLQSLLLFTFPNAIFGPDTYGRRIKKLEEEVAQLKQQKNTDLSVTVTKFEWSPDGKNHWTENYTDNDLYFRAIVNDPVKGQYYIKPAKFRDK